MFPIQVIEIILSFIPTSSYRSKQNIFLLSKRYYKYLAHELNINPVDIFDISNILITIQIKSYHENVDYLFMKTYNYYTKSSNIPSIYEIKARRDKKRIHLNNLYKHTYSELCSIYSKKYQCIKGHIENISYTIENNLKGTDGHDSIDQFTENLLFVYIPLIIINGSMTTLDSLTRLKKLL